MSKVWQLSYYSFKHLIFNKGLFIAIITSFSYLGLWLIYRPQSFDVNAYQAEFFKLFYIVLIYYSIKILGSDFINGTYKILFTNKFSRNQIMISKLLLNIKVAIFFWLIVQLLNPIIGLIIGDPYKLTDFLSKNTLFSLLLFLFIGLVVGTYSLMLNAITLNLVTTFIATLPTIWFLYFISPVLIPNLDQLKGLGALIAHIPFFIIGSGFFVQEMTPLQIFELLLWSGVFFLVSLIVINLRDLKK